MLAAFHSRPTELSAPSGPFIDTLGREPTPRVFPATSGVPAGPWILAALENRTGGGDRRHRLWYSLSRGPKRLAFLTVPASARR